MEETIKKVTTEYDGEDVIIKIPKSYIEKTLTNPDWMVNHACFKIEDLDQVCEYIANTIDEPEEDVGNGHVSFIDVAIISLAFKCWEEGDDAILVPHGLEFMSDVLE